MAVSIIGATVAHDQQDTTQKMLDAIEHVQSARNAMAFLAVAAPAAAAIGTSEQIRAGFEYIMDSCARDLDKALWQLTAAQ